MEGKTVLAHLCSGKQKEDIDLSGIEQGVYILKISFKSGVYTKKLLLK
jgi:hypothetical protein